MNNKEGTINGRLPVKNKKRVRDTILVKHGSVVRRTGAIDPIKTALADSQRPDPWKLLQNYMTRNNMRVFELFKRVDKAKPDSITKQEFRATFIVSQVEVTLKSLLEKFNVNTILV